MSQCLAASTNKQLSGRNTGEAVPELPEVESLMRAVKKVAESATVEKLKFYRKDLREPIPIAELKRILVGEEILEVSRRSKYMLMTTSKGSALIHLGMTGNMVCQDIAKPGIKHTHAVFSLKGSDNQPLYLHYIDPRRFGRIDCHKGADPHTHKFLKDLGPEPLEIKDLEKTSWFQTAQAPRCRH